MKVWREGREPQSFAEAKAFEGDGLKANAGRDVGVCDLVATLTTEVGGRVESRRRVQMGKGLGHGDLRACIKWSGVIAVP